MCLVDGFWVRFFVVCCEQCESARAVELAGIEPCGALPACASVRVETP